MDTLVTHSLISLPLERPGLVTTAILMTQTTSTLSIPSRPYTTSRRTRSCRLCFSPQLIVSLMLFQDTLDAGADDAETTRRRPRCSFALVQTGRYFAARQGRQPAPYPNQGRQEVRARCRQVDKEEVRFLVCTLGSPSHQCRRVEEAADKYSFIAMSLGLEWKGPVPSENSGPTKL